MTATTTAAEELPRWDLGSIFPGPRSPQFRADLEATAGAIADLEVLCDRHGIGRRRPGAVDDDLLAAFADVITAYNALLERAMRIEGYLVCLVAGDVRDETARDAAGEWRQLKVGLARLVPRLTAWVGDLDIDALARSSAIARDHAPALKRLQTAAAHLMPAGEEDLAAALAPSGATAWMALRDDLAGRATARVELDGEERQLPLSEIGNLAFHPDRDVRRRAYEAETGAWHGLAVPLAVALNGVKSQQLTLALRRGWNDPLDQALFANAVDRPTLEAMMAAIQETLPDYRRYLRAKARLLGLPRLAGYDLHAPIGEPAPWPFDKARAFITQTFTAECPRLGALAERAFAERWIDAGTREGKDGGAFAIPVGDDRSRIFANYLPVYDWMSALAHELGHAYHVVAVVAQGRTMLQAPAEMAGVPISFPMTLAETASTISEAIVQRAARAEAPPSQEASLLDGWLQALTLNVFATLPMFAFEQAMFAARGRRELSATEIEAIMATAWHEIAGDAIDPDTMPATDWTAPHLFIDEKSFYNFPYAFGMLFALGLMAVRDPLPEGFCDRFDTLLADSGMREARELAADFGIDLHDPAFWRASLDAFRADVDRFEALSERLSLAPLPDRQAAAKT